MLTVCTRAAVALLLILAGITSAHAQTITFAHIADPHLYNPDAAGLTSTNATTIGVERQAVFVQTILAVNQLAKTGTHVDFVAITGDLGVLALQPADVEPRAADFARVLSVLLTRRIYLLPGAGDLAAGPTGHQRLQQFIEATRRALGSSKELVDLTQTVGKIDDFRIVGLDARIFLPRQGGVPDPAARAAAQARELDRAACGAALTGQMLILTQVPPIEVSSTSAAKPASLWDISDSVHPKLDVLDVCVSNIFAGQVGGQQKDFYEQPHDFDPHLATYNRPVSVWVAPPMRERGFILATVTTAGDATVAARWLPAITSAVAIPDKSSELLKARAYESGGELQKAQESYIQALGSSDLEVRNAADEGLRRTQALMQEPRWRLLHEFTPLRWLSQYHEIAIAGLFVSLAALAIIYRRNYDDAPFIDTPVKVSDDAPASLFVAELRIAFEDAKEIVEAEQIRGSIGPANANVSFATPSAEWETLLKTVPDIAQIKTGTVLVAMLNLLRSYRRRIELQVGGPATNLRVFGSLWRGGQLLATWRVAEDEDGPIDTRRAAEQMAYNILWELGKK